MTGQNEFTGRISATVGCALQLRYFMRYEQANAKTEYLPHAHAWGQVIFVTRHVLEMNVEGERLLTPATISV